MFSSEKVIKVVCIVLLIWTSLIANAQTTTWTGTISNVWTNGNNWSNGVPQIGYDVIIGPAPNNAKIEQINVLIKSVYIQSGATLTVGSTGIGLQVFPHDDDIGIINYGTLIIQGTVKIDGGTGPTQTGLQNFNVCTVSGSLEINGLGSGFDGDGIRNVGQLTVNGGTIDIGKFTPIDGNGITNEGTFTVNSGSNVFVNRNHESGIRNNDGATFVNSGTIKIGNYGSQSTGTNTGIANLGTFTSNSVLEINDAVAQGIVNFKDLTLDNTVIIRDCAPFGINNFVSASKIDFKGGIDLNILHQDIAGTIGMQNKGTMAMKYGSKVNIESSEDGIRNLKNFTVNGRLTINTTEGAGHNAIENSDIFALATTCAAMIHITSNTPIINTDAGFLINDGVIIYEGTKAANVSINRQLIISTEGDHFSIDADNGIYVTEDKKVWTGCESTSWNDANNWADREIPDENSDVLIIDYDNNDPQINSLSTVSTVIVNESTQLNITASGDLTCTGSSDHSLIIHGEVINNGWIRISDNMNNTGIECYGTLTINSATSISECQIGIKNEGQINLNEFAFLLIDDVSSNGIINNEDFSSNGRIIFGSFTPLSGNSILNNSEFTVGSNCRAQIEIRSNNPIIDNSNFVNGGNIIYEGSLNSNIQTNNGFVVSTLGNYVSITSDNGVYQTEDVVVWTGCKNDLWIDSQNWTSSGFPSSSDNVLIPPNTLHEPVLISDETIGSLEIEELASMTIPQGLELNITGSDKNSITILGELINEGTINISNNSANRGISCHGFFTNNGATNITDCSIGIYAEIDSELENGVGGTVIMNTCNRGLITDSESINKGTIDINDGFTGVLFKASFTNDINSILRVNNYSLTGSFIGDTFINRGTIEAGQNNSSNGWGYRFENCTFTNEATGKIDMDNLSWAFYMFGTTFSNHGTIFLDNFQMYSIRDDDNSVFTNTNVITINAGDIFQTSMYFDGEFTNTSDGTITASSVSGDDIYYNGSFLNDGIIDIEGSISSSESSNISGGGVIELEGDWETLGSHDMDEMTLVFNGSGNSSLNTAMTLGSLEVEKEGAELMIGGDPASVDEIEIVVDVIMASGVLNLNGRIIRLLTGATIEGENNSTYIYDQAPDFQGSIVYSELLDSPSENSMGNLGCTVSSDGNLGLFTVTRSHNSTTTDGNTSINRTYDTDYSNSSAVVDFTFEYLDHEIVGLDESTFGLYLISNIGLVEVPFINTNTGNNTMQYKGPALDGGWTIAESDRTFYWTGENWTTDWHHPFNWSIYGVPNVNYDVVIPSTFTLDPHIEDLDAFCKSLVIMEDAKLTNDRMFLIKDSEATGVTIHGEYINNEGVLILLDIAGDGIHVTNTGKLTNNEQVRNPSLSDVNGTIIKNDGEFINGGDIIISGTGGIPIENNSTASFINSGDIEIGELVNDDFDGIAGIYNAGSFTSELGSEISFGYIDILPILNDVGADFTNSGLLKIGQVNNSSIIGNGIETYGSFDNHHEIRIDRVTQNGIVHLGGIFTNYSTIKIGQSNNNTIGGIGIYSEFEFHNLGTLNLNRTLASGISIMGSDAFFTNEGDINIGHNAALASDGITVDEGAEITNLSNGNIDVRNSVNGIKIASELQGSSGSFTNLGNFYFSDISNYGIASFDFFENVGLIGGNGTIVSTFPELGGTISPGLSPGVIHLTSPIEAQAGSILEIEVEGTNPTEHDLLTSIEVLTITDMSLDVQINYTPQTGDRIIFMEAPLIIGQFTSLITSLPPGWTIDYGGEFVALEFAAVLPVELISFDAVLKNDIVNLTWITATEVNNEGFEVLHSTDLKNWKDIGFVVGQGNTLQTQEYQFDHLDPLAGNNYYKLRQVDYDGAYTDSDTRIVSLKSKSEEFSIDVYPNPSADYINLRWSNDEHTFSTIQIVDVKGQMIKQINTDALEGELQIDLDALPTGSYTLLLIGQNQVFSRQFHKTDF